MSLAVNIAAFVLLFAGALTLRSSISQLITYARKSVGKRHHDTSSTCAAFTLSHDNLNSREER